MPRLSNAPATLATLFVLLGLLGGCFKRPDPDGRLAGAEGLAPGTTRDGQLLCRVGDCADWYRVELGEPGALYVEVAPHGDRTETNYAAILTDPGGDLLKSGDPSGGSLELLWQVEPGTYFVAVKKSGWHWRPFRYEIAARFLPAPPPPPPPPEPQFEPVRSEVLEVEGEPGEARAVLIGIGRGAGIREGHRGRLIDGGRAIGELEVVDVYPEGSRARIAGSLQAPITPATEAEIDVPKLAAP